MKLTLGRALMESLEEITERGNLRSGMVLSGTGSLHQVTLRNVRSFPDEFPITVNNKMFCYLVENEGAIFSSKP